MFPMRRAPSLVMVRASRTIRFSFLLVFARVLLFLFVGMFDVSVERSLARVAFTELLSEVCEAFVLLVAALGLCSVETVLVCSADETFEGASELVATFVFS